MPKEPHWSRRNLLTPRGLGTSMGGLLSALMSERNTAAPDGDALAGCWAVSRQAMACEFTVYLPPNLGEPLPLGEAALDEIDRLEEILTVYRETSMMTRVNRHAHESPVVVDYLLYELLERCRHLTQITDGTFDAAIGTLIKAWGFFKGPKRIPPDDELQRFLQASGIGHVILDEKARSVRYDSPDIEINLGSIGKGFAIDRALKLLREECGVSDALMQGGTSSLAAMGHAPEDPRGWLVGLQDPEDPARRLATLLLSDRAMGTSGDAQQFFEIDGRRYGHVLDPRTGRPAQSDLASATAITRDGASADALATALYVMGLDKAIEFCQNHRDVGALLVPSRTGRDHDPSSPRVVALNLAAEDIHLNLDADLQQRRRRDQDDGYRV